VSDNTAPFPTASNGFQWPNKTRIAVVVTCLMENWSGDKGPPFSVQTTSLKPGTHDRAAMTWGTYGSRMGVWRLLKILEENNVPSTFVANAHSMELAPKAVEVMLQTGHEIAAHSYTQDALMAYMTPDEGASDDSEMRRRLQEINWRTAQRLAKPCTSTNGAYRRTHRGGGFPMVRRLQCHRFAVLCRDQTRLPRCITTYRFCRSPCAAR